MNRIQKLERLRDLAEELDALQQELAGPMNVSAVECRERHEILDGIFSDAEDWLETLHSWQN